jgi:hypothetical protein
MNHQIRGHAACEIWNRAGACTQEDELRTFRAFERSFCTRGSGIDVFRMR